VFLVITTSPLDEQWEERDRLMMQVKPAYYSGCTCYEGLRQRDHEWKVDTLESAQELKRKLESISSVQAFIREV
jgi:hypothetical protein